MARNRSGEYKGLETGPKRTLAKNMAIYDSLPPHIRKIFQDAPYSMTARTGALNASEKTIRDTLTRIARESARATYGDSYPIDLIRV